MDDATRGSARVLSFPPARAGLLGNVREFVREQPATGLGVRRVLAVTECDIASDCKGERVHASGRRVSRGVRVYAHPAEVVAEARFKKTARGCIEWPPGPV